MYKRLLIMCVVLLLVCMTNCYADGFDLSKFNNSDEYIVKAEPDNDLIYIYKKADSSSMTFSHKYARSDEKSFFLPCIIVKDYFKAKPSPHLYLMIYLKSTKPIYANAVTINGSKAKYKFTGVSIPSSIKSDNKGYSETLLIQFGYDNLYALNDISEPPMPSLEMFSPDYDASKICILHGLEDIEIKMNDHVYTDLFFLQLDLLISDSSGRRYIIDGKGTPTITMK